MASIHIDDFSFGKIVVNGVPYNSDIKIIDGNVASNWWRRAGHKVDVTDIEDILESRPDVVVLGRGSPGLMKATESVKRLLIQSGIELIQKRSGRAMKIFNRLVSEGKNVAGGFHVGC